MVYCRELTLPSDIMFIPGNFITYLFISQSLVISCVQGFNNFMAFDRVSEFTHYSLYFKETKNAVAKCCAYDIHNGTHQSFTKSVDRCPARNYSPRFLTTSQISWKSTRSESKNEVAQPIDDNNSVGHKNRNSTYKKKAEKEIIHKYLAFALLLPQQPFSTDLFRSLVSVGPMFPTVTIVSGSGYDFKELCRQYNVRSFPQLFFFKDGLLSGTYSGIHSAPEIASKLARWTQSLPKALPTPIKETLSHGFLEGRNLHYYFWAPGSVLYSGKVFGYKVIIRVPYCTEPIVSNAKHLVQYDSLLFVLSGLFVFFRFIHYLCFSKSANVSVSQ